MVDDNETNCQLIAGMFAGSHHRLIFGSSGEEAVAKARELKPDILLLDVRMPGMDGHEALDEIRKIPGLEFLPVIAMTASNLMSEDNQLKERFSGLRAQTVFQTRTVRRTGGFSAATTPKRNLQKKPAVPAERKCAGNLRPRRRN